MLVQIEEKAEKKNEKFNWYVQKSDIKGYDHIIVVESQTENQAHRRGLLIVKKYCRNLDLYYWVKPPTQA